MTTDNDNVPIIDNKDQHQYELKMGDEVAILVYQRHGDTINLIHTEVPEALGGHGLGNKLARFALEEARAQNLQVVPSCPFVAAFIRRHPDYISLVVESERERLTRK